VSLDQVDLPDQSPDGDDSDQELKVREIKEAMAKLPDGYRVVISLYLFEGYDHEEISHILKISENTSRTQFMRAKIKLKGLLEKRGA
jgi:RNA polymerase sigma factor (sigma-70 family)